MTQTPQFRSRALAVREEARQHLLQVRQSRLAQKQLPLVIAPEPVQAEMPSEAMKADIAPDFVDEAGSDGQELALPEQPDTDAAMPTIVEAEASTEPVATPEVDPEPASLAAPSPAVRPRETTRKAPRAASTNAKPKPARPKQAAPQASARGPAPRPGTPEDLSALRAALAEMETMTLADSASQHIALIEPMPEVEAEMTLPQVEDTAAAPIGAEAVAPAEPAQDVAAEHEPEDAPEDTADIPEMVDLEAAAPVETTPDSEAEVSLAEVDAKPEEKGAPPSDLLLLPGAAPGLVWLLQEMGVRNLSDLAKLEPDALAAGLGIVGRILDVSIWTRFARNHIAQAGAEPQ